MGRQKNVLSTIEERLRIRNKLVRQALAECLGTLILVLFGCGALAQRFLSKGTHGGFLTVNLAFGFAVTLGILIAGQVSGGHLNPAVTFAMCFLAREPWIKLPIYALAQTLGAFLGAGIVFGLYHDAIWDFDKTELTVGGNGTAGIFATYPSPHLNLVNGFFDQVRGSWEDTGTFEGRSFGLAMGLSFSWRMNCNLKRRYPERFLEQTHWWWVPIVAPFLGAIAGVIIYQLMIGCHDEPSPPASEQETVKLSNVKHKERV
ncbi:AQP3 protein, partial [Eolophus roseicapillus]|nr:AQP3 protein [Eolophus roseicapilla]